MQNKEDHQRKSGKLSQLKPKLAFEGEKEFDRT